MSTVAAASGEEIVYPEDDGLPRSDNTRQFRWIVTIQGGLDALFRDVYNVFVAGNLLWYPVQVDNTIRAAPDALVVFGRPKGERGSYLQWREDNIAPQVVFEVASPGNRPGQLTVKFEFYDRYGVEEYYFWDPDRIELKGWLRMQGALRPIPAMHGWVSPRLGVRFELVEDELCLYGPDGRKFATYIELVAQEEQQQKRAEQFAAEREQERQRAEQERQRAERLAAQLRAAGIEPDA
jgi:Uma2 family endonuclease